MSEKYSVAVGMYALSRTPPKGHLIDDLADRVIEAGEVGAKLLDGDLIDEAMIEGAFDFFVAIGLRALVPELSDQELRKDLKNLIEVALYGKTDALGFDVFTGGGR